MLTLNKATLCEVNFKVELYLQVTLVQIENSIISIQYILCRIVCYLPARHWNLQLQTAPTDPTSKHSYSGVNIILVNLLDSDWLKTVPIKH
jgi:hypothetical protein